MTMKNMTMTAMTVAAVAVISAASVEAATVKVDVAKELGPVKCVNAVGQPPMNGALSSWSMMHYLKEAGIPYSRLHDVGSWLGHGLYADVPNMFKDFDADENDPKSYTFAATDSLIKALVDNGVEPYFRLGVTIENFVEDGFPRVNTMPPKDYAKWARVCEHVIRHYTEGWANGFKYKITYWEIWNEPENNPDTSKNPMWGGDWRSFCDFYGVVASHLKAKFPHLKIGGYGSCGFYAGTGANHVAAANSSPRMSHFVDCAHEFLKRAKDENWPLDFFSFHSYSYSKEALRQVEFANGLLDDYGFTRDKTERHFNEWLPGPRFADNGTAVQASRIAAELIGLQNGPCDVACIYDARCSLGNYSSLFDPSTCLPRKAYYVFRAFNELRRLGTAVSATSDDPEVRVTAATGKGRLAVMVANETGSPRPLAIRCDGYEFSAAVVTDADRTHQYENAINALPPYSFAVIFLDVVRR